MNNCLVISDGYEITVENRKMPLEEVCKLLLTKKQHLYNCALRDEYQAVLTRHMIVCPTCGFRQTATRRHVLGEGTPRVNKKDVERWACEAQQMALWDDGFLELNELLLPSSWECPRCGTVHALGHHCVTVRLTADKKRLRIHCRGTVAGQHVSEALEFNIRKGRVVFTQYNPWEGKQVIRDVTTLPSWFRESYTHKLLEKNIRLQKMVYRRLRDIWGKPLPYNIYGLQTQMLFVMCRFVGYPKSFYEAIPWCDDDGLVIHPYFSRIAKKLHEAKHVQQVLADMKPLSEFRSVRRLLSEQSGLLFYHREASALLEAMRYDPGSFCSLLRGQDGYWLLGQLAAYPGMMDFLKDYLKVRGMAALRKQLDKSQGVIHFYALEYHAMNPSRRRQEQLAWKTGNIEFHPGPGFSLPVRLGEHRVDGSNSGYEFRYLRSSKEFQECGKRLNSYLGIQPEGPVVAITRGTELVGAAYLCDDQVIHTESIDCQPLLAEPRSAFEAWCHENGLRLPEDDEDDEIYCF